MTTNPGRPFRRGSGSAMARVMMSAGLSCRMKPMSSAGLAAGMKGRARDDDRELRDEEQRIGRLRGVVQFAARRLGEPELNTPDKIGGPVGQLGLRPRPVVDAERTGRVLRRPVLMRRVRKVVAQGEHARLPALGGEHDGDRLRRADGIGEVLGSLDLDLKTDGRVTGLCTLAQARQRDGRNGAGGDGGCQFPRRHGSQVIRRC